MSDKSCQITASCEIWKLPWEKHVSSCIFSYCCQASKVTEKLEAFDSRVSRVIILVSIQRQMKESLTVAGSCFPESGDQLCCCQVVIDKVVVAFQPLNTSDLEVSNSNEEFVDSTYQGAIWKEYPPRIFQISNLICLFQISNRQRCEHG